MPLINEKPVSNLNSPNKAQPNLSKKISISPDVSDKEEEEKKEFVNTE